MILREGKLLYAPPDLEVRCHVEDKQVVQFRSLKHIKPADEVMIHESVTTKSPAAGLLKRGLGVHFCLLPDGQVEQHADLAVRVAHIGAGDHNYRSIGIEIVTPYYAPAGPWQEVIHAPWADRGQDYVLPTLQQCNALRRLVAWLVSPDSGLPLLSLRWPGLVAGKGFRLGGFPKDKQPAYGGIWCHHYSWEHADGAWEVYFLYLCLAKGMAGPEARKLAANLATGCKGWLPA